MLLNHSVLRACSLFALTLSSMAAIATEPRLDQVQLRRTIIEAPNGMSTEAADVNNAGVVVGSYHGPFGRAFAWTRRGGFVDLEGVVESEFSLAFDVNECGQIVGELDGHAALWNTFEELEDLGTLGGNVSVARAINDRGDVVGYAQVIPGGRVTPFLWTETDGMRPIVECAGESGLGTGINNAREVVGVCDGAPGFPSQAFFWSEATGRVDFPLTRFGSTSAIAINDRGEVAGTAMTRGPTFGAVAFKWIPRTQRVVFLRKLGEQLDVASDINRFGWVAGAAVETFAPVDVRRAAAWLTPRLGFLIDPSLGTSSRAAGLNDVGSIAGAIRLGNADLRAALWEAPPVIARALRQQGVGRCLRPCGSQHRQAGNGNSSVGTTE